MLTVLKEYQFSFSQPVRVMTFNGLITAMSCQNDHHNEIVFFKHLRRWKLNLWDEVSSSVFLNLFILAQRVTILKTTVKIMTELTRKFLVLVISGKAERDSVPAKSDFRGTCFLYFSTR